MQDRLLFRILIGKRQTGRILAPDAHKDFVDRWSKIIKLGSPSNKLEELFVKYPPPGNCTTIDAPKLNEEVRISFKDKQACLRTDSRIVFKQGTITACISAAAKLMSIVLSKKNKTVLFLKLSSSAYRHAA